MFTSRADVHDRVTLVKDLPSSFSMILRVTYPTIHDEPRYTVHGSASEFTEANLDRRSFIKQRFTFSL